MLLSVGRFESQSCKHFDKNLFLFFSVKKKKKNIKILTWEVLSHHLHRHMYVEM